MQKLSFYDFMSIFLPGSVAGFILYSNIPFLQDLLAQYDAKNLVSIGVILSLVLFTGVFIHMIGHVLNGNVYKWMGLYYYTYHVFTNSKTLEPIHSFVKKKATEHFHKGSFEELSPKEFGYFFDKVYYQLEVNGMMDTPKSYQSYFHFFRNFLTLSFICVLLSLLHLILCSFTTNGLIYGILSLTIMLISFAASKWAQSKMVAKIFWFYYASNNQH